MGERKIKRRMRGTEEKGMRKIPIIINELCQSLYYIRANNERHWEEFK